MHSARRVTGIDAPALMPASQSMDAGPALSGGGQQRPDSTPQRQTDRGDVNCQYAVSGALIAPTTAHAERGAGSRRFRLLFIAGLLAVSVLVVGAPSASLARSAPRTEAQRIVSIAASHIGAHFRLGTEGPRTFDCSGLIYRVYKEAGLLNRVGGARRLAAGYYKYFKQRGLVSRSNPKVGDLVIWKEHGRIAHSGIYVGNGRVISALINPWGVKRTHINTLHAKFFAFLHVRLQR